MRVNLKNARRVWARVTRILMAENASSWVSGMVYKAIVQSVFLFGSEPLCLAPAALKSLEVFHVKAETDQF